MAILEVLKFPDSRLRHKGKAVESVTPELQQLADDMLETMYHQKGIGLASIQVGVEVRLLVMDTLPKDPDDLEEYREQMTDLEKAVTQPVIIFNPEITKKEGSTSYDEGCLSVPGFYETVKRAEYIEVSGLDRNGNPIDYKLDGLLSICMQHEIDHLDGKVFIDRLSPIKANRLKSKIKKIGYPKPEESAEESESEPQP